MSVHLLSHNLPSKPTPDRPKRKNQRIINPEIKSALAKKAELERKILYCVQLLILATPLSIDATCQKVAQTLPLAHTLRRIQALPLSKNKQNSISELLKLLGFFENLLVAYKVYKDVTDRMLQEFRSMESLPKPNDPIPNLDSKADSGKFLKFFDKNHPLVKHDQALNSIYKSISYYAMEYYSLQTAVKEFSWDAATITDLTNFETRTTSLKTYALILSPFAPHLSKIITTFLSTANAQLSPLLKEYAAFHKETAEIKSILKSAKNKSTYYTHILSLNFFHNTKSHRSLYQRLQKLLCHRWMTVKKSASLTALYEDLFPAKIRLQSALMEKCASFWNTEKSDRLTELEVEQMKSLAEDTSLPLAFQVQFDLIVRMHSSHVHPGSRPLSQRFNPEETGPTAQLIHDWLLCNTVLLNNPAADEEAKYYDLLRQFAEAHGPFINDLCIYNEDLKIATVKEYVYAPFNKLIAFDLGALRNVEICQKDCFALNELMLELVMLNMQTAHDKNIRPVEAIRDLLKLTQVLQRLFQSISGAKPLSNMNRERLEVIQEHLWLLNAISNQPAMFSVTSFRKTMKLISGIACATTATVFKILKGYRTKPLEELGLIPETTGSSINAEVCAFIHQAQAITDFAKYRLFTMQDYQWLVRHLLSEHIHQVSSLLEN